MHITIIEPFYGGSHKRWIDELIKFTDFEFTLLTMPGTRWKERMRFGATELAKQFVHNTDLIIASSMLNVKKFKELTKTNVPILLYFHENQFAYPISPHSKTNHEEFENIHIESIKASDKICFNSQYNHDSLKKHFPNFNGEILPLGMDLKSLDQYRQDKHETPTILWNHRWEFDKNPDEFFEILSEVNRTHEFNLILLGESPHVVPECFLKAKEIYQERILHFGHVDSFKEYIQLLSTAHISLTTSHHDFFGQSVVESAYLNVYPILPNRLAYPEHFKNKEYFYNNKKEAISILINSLENFQNLTVSSEIIEKYDWEIISAIYKNTILETARVFS